MCLMCDGYTDKDVVRMTDLHIRVHGYSLVQVEDDKPWCYTIGLQESYGHPELTTCDLEMDAQVELIQTVARLVAASQADARHLKQHGIRLVTVHRRHLDGDRFGSWERFYERPVPPGTFAQVLPPSSWLCPCHQHTVTRLDRPPTTRRTRTG